MQITKNKLQTNVKINKPIVYLMLSGGVDSSVSAFILKQLGFKVIGIYMLRWWNPSLGENCPVAEDLDYVFKVGRQLNMPVYIVDFREQYSKQVLSTILHKFKQGVTPNPDTLCNRHIKFKAYIDFVEKHTKRQFLIATGHYALTWNSLFFNGSLEKQNIESRNGLFVPIDSYKDQTYFLYDINRTVLSKTVFPLAFLIKPWVRSIAASLGLATAKRQDSTGVCFIGDIELSEFLHTKLGVKKGPIIDIETEQIVGQHNGLWFYTIGQRKGLGIGGVSPAYYVVKKDINTNRLYVAKGRFNKYIFSNKIEFVQDNWLVGQSDLNVLLKKQARQDYLGALIRYRSNPYSVQLDISKQLTIYKDIFDKQSVKDSRELNGFWAVAPGQSIVFYDKPYIKIKYNRIKEFYAHLGITEDNIINKVSSLYTDPKVVENIVKFLRDSYRDSKVIGGGIIKQ